MWAGLRSERLCILLLCGVALLARLPFLTESLWFDELWSTNVMLSDVPRWLRTMARDVHPPAYSTLMFAWVHVWGDSEISIRTPPLVAGIGTLVLLYLIARRLGGVGMALVVASMFALSPAAIWYATEARQYSVWVFCTTLAAYALLREHEGRSAAWRRVYGLSLLLAQGMHYYTFFLIVALSVLALVARPRTKWILRANLIVAGIFFLYLTFKLIVLPPELNQGRTFGYAEFTRLFGVWFPQGHTLDLDLPGPLTEGLKWFYLVVFCLGAVALARHCCHDAGGWRGPESITLIFLLAPVLGVFGTSCVFQVGYKERSLLLVLPFYLMVLGLALRTIPIRWAYAGAVVLLLTLASASLFQLYYQDDRWTVYKQNPDWRGAAAFIRRVLGEDQTPVRTILASPGLPLKYYLDFRTFQRLQQVETVQPDQAFTVPAGAEDQLKTILIIQDHFWFGDNLQPIVSLADRLYQPQATFHGKGITIHYYSRASGIQPIANWWPWILRT
jgi:hypothetical protein